MSYLNTQQTDEAYTSEAQDDIEQNNISKSLRSEPSEKQLEDQRTKNFVENGNFSKSQNNPYNPNNLQFLIPEVQEYAKNEVDTKNNSKKQKSPLKGSLQTMKYGNENQKEIIKALKNNKKRKIIVHRQQNLTSMENINEVERFEEVEIQEDMEEEDEEEADDDKQVISFGDLNNELNLTNLMDFVKKADPKLVEINDSDIDFDQNKTTRLNIKRRNDVKQNQVTISESKNNLENSMSVKSNTIGQISVEEKQEEEVSNSEDGDSDIDPASFAPQKNLLAESTSENKDDDIFDYSYENEEQEEEESDENNSQHDSNDEFSQSFHTSLSGQVKIKVPFTAFKSQIENSFMRFLKESVYPQDQERNIATQNQSQTNQPTNSKKRQSISLKTIFRDKRAAYLNGNSYLRYFRENFWMILNNFIKKNKVFKTTEFYLTGKIPQGPPPLERKRLNACEQMHINF